MHEEPSTGFLARDKRKLLIVALLALSDTVALLGATLLATYVRFERLFTYASFENIDGRIGYYQVALAVSVVWLGFLISEHLYDLERLTWGAGEFSRVVRALAMGVVGFILLTFLIKTPGLSRVWTVLAFAFAVVFVSAGRFVIRHFLARARRRGRMLRRTLVVGDDDADVLRGGALLVGVLDPEEELPPVAPGEQPAEEGGPDPPDGESAGGARCEARNDVRHGWSSIRGSDPADRTGKGRLSGRRAPRTRPPVRNPG